MFQRCACIERLLLAKRYRDRRRMLTRRSQPTTSLFEVQMSNCTVGIVKTKCGNAEIAKFQSWKTEMRPANSTVLSDMYVRADWWTRYKQPWRAVPFCHGATPSQSEKVSTCTNCFDAACAWWLGRSGCLVKYPPRDLRMMIHECV